MIVLNMLTKEGNTYRLATKEVVEVSENKREDTSWVKYYDPETDGIRHGLVDMSFDDVMDAIGEDNGNVYV